MERLDFIYRRHPALAKRTNDTVVSELIASDKTHLGEL